MKPNLTPEYESLLALKQYLSKADFESLQEMVKNEEPINIISIFVNNAITKRQIKTAKLLDAEQAAMEYKEYEHRLSEDEKLWVQKFYYEMYGNAIYNVPKDYRLLQTKEMIQESNRNRNNFKSDIFDIASKKEVLESLSIEENALRYMGEAEKTLSSNEESRDWEDVFMCFGYEASLNFLIGQCIEELKVKTLDNRLTLIRFYIKMNRLRLSNNREIRNPTRTK